MNREQRVKKVMQSATQSGLLIAGLTLGISLLQDLHVGGTGLQSFIQGVGYGIRTAFPLLLLWIMFKAYQEMDEYGRLQMLKAAAVGFVVMLGFSMAYYPLQEAGKIPPLPSWVSWTLGMLAYLISMGVLSRR